jgi:hypothetical protein
MGRRISTRWEIVLDLEEGSVSPSSWEAALDRARSSSSGVLSGAGEGGDWIELEFNFSRAAVWYRTAGEKMLRPYFPHRHESEQQVEEEELLRGGMSREEGFRLFRAIMQSGQLPAAIPEERLNQPCLPGLEAFEEQETRRRVIEWRPLG